MKYQYSSNYYKNQFCAQNNFSKWQTKYAEYAIGELYFEHKLNFGANLKDDLIDSTKERFGINPIVWFFIQSAIVKIIELAIAYWKSQMEITE